MSAVDLQLPIASGPETRRFVGLSLRPHRGTVALGVAITLVGAVAGLLGPALLGHIVDIITDGSGSIGTSVLLLLAVAVVQALAVGVGGVVIARLGANTLADTRERVVEKVLQLPTATVEDAGSGDILSRVSGDVDVVADTVSNTLPEVITALVTISTTIVGLAVVDWRFALAGALAAPIQLHTLRWYLRTSNPLYATERRAEAGRSQALLDTLGAVDTVHTFGLGAHQLDRVTLASTTSLDVSLSATHLRSRFFGRLNIAEVIGLGAILIVGYFLVRDGNASVGACTAAALYFHRLFDPINILLASVDGLQSAHAGLARLVGIATMTVPPTPERVPARDHFAIELDDVSYRYDDHGFALRAIDLTVPQGDTIALVGASGAGKSTVAKIIAGVLTPTDGEARITGRVAMVTQEVHVFAGPLGDDLRLAAPDASDEQLRAVMDAVGASGWVDALPDGLATIVGEGGHSLDGTQAQQLALARVLLADPDIVVLDEATAEAGSAGATVLERAARAVIAGRSAVVVAHRLSQARTAGQIAVVEDGAITELGTHDELVARDGRYGALWRAWSAHRP